MNYFTVLFLCFIKIFTPANCCEIKEEYSSSQTYLSVEKLGTDVLTEIFQHLNRPDIANLRFINHDLKAFLDKDDNKLWELWFDKAGLTRNSQNLFYKQRVIEFFSKPAFGLVEPVAGCFKSKFKADIQKTEREINFYYGFGRSTSIDIYGNVTSLYRNRISVLELTELESTLMQYFQQNLKQVFSCPYQGGKITNVNSKGDIFVGCFFNKPLDTKAFKIDGNGLKFLNHNKFLDHNHGEGDFWPKSLNNNGLYIIGKFVDLSIMSTFGAVWSKDKLYIVEEELFEKFETLSLFQKTKFFLRKYFKNRIMQETPPLTFLFNISEEGYAIMGQSYTDAVKIIRNPAYKF